MSRFSFAIVLVLIASAGAAFGQQYNHSHDEFIPGGVDHQKHIVLTGRVGRLIIEGKVDGQSSLDIRGLAVGDVIIEGKVDGQSTVTVSHCRNFMVEGKIDGAKTDKVSHPTKVVVTYTCRKEVRGGENSKDCIIIWHGPPAARR